MSNTFDPQLLRQRLSPVNSDVTSGKDHPPETAVAVIIDPQHGGSMLLIRRTERESDPWSGQIAFPGGHKASSDRTLLDTAMRETDEEVGIALRQHEILGALPPVRSLTRRISVAPFVFLLKEREEIRRNVEVADAFWIPLRDLAGSVIVKSEVQMDNVRDLTDSYVYRGNVIWGLTFRIINILLDSIGRKSHWPS